MTREEANAIYDILVRECVAPDPDLKWSSRDAFVEAFTWSNVIPTEWRFQGQLGFGGKFYPGPPHRVSCYPEDETPERKRMIARANEALARFNP